MTAKQFVKIKYPNCEVFCQRYDNRIGKPTYCILTGNGFEVLYYNPDGSDTPSKAWAYAKNQIVNNIPPNNEQ